MILFFIIRRNILTVFARAEMLRLIGNNSRVQGSPSVYIILLKNYAVSLLSPVVNQPRRPLQSVSRATQQVYSILINVLTNSPALTRYVLVQPSGRGLWGWRAGGEADPLASSLKLLVEGLMDCALVGLISITNPVRYSFRKNICFDKYFHKS